MSVVILRGDAASLPVADGSVDAVVCDPPYGLEFMGREWDTFRPSNARIRERVDGRTNPAEGKSVTRTPEAYVAGNPFQQWCEAWARECLRVLKPGGHLAAFGGTRTYHRLACGIEDAGFEIRDSIGCATGLLAWCYGSGFPKSRNVSADQAFCQCVPSVRGAATEDAAQSAARLLLEDLRRAGQADAASLEDLHGVPVALHPGYAIPGSAEQDVLGGVRGEGGERGPAGRRAAPAPEDGRGGLLGMRETVRAPAGMAEAGEVANLFPALQREGARQGTGEACPQGPSGLVAGGQGALASEDARGRESGMGRRGDVQAAEGELHRPEVRPLPARPDDDGPLGRLHHGAPASDGPVDWPAAAADRGREPQGPESAQQRPGEPRAVSVERGSQAWRGWPVCGGCGKPALPAGLGTALKSSWEPIVVARKPFAGTVAANVLEHGTGALNIGGCRVAHAGAADLEASQAKNPGRADTFASDVYGAGRSQQSVNDEGRWPPNVLLTHSADCEPVGVREVPSNARARKKPAGAVKFPGAYGELVNDQDRPYGDPGVAEVVEAWDCAPGCPVAELDAQSGVSKSSGGKGAASMRTALGGDVYGDYSHGTLGRNAGGLGDVGGASRFFPQFRHGADDLVFFPIKSDTCEQPGDESTMAANTSAGRKTESSGGSSPTDGFGSRPTAPFPTDTKSIIGITTSSTTISATSCVSQPNGTTTTTSDSENSTGGSMGSSSAVASGAGNGNRSPSITSGEPEPGRDTANPANANTGANGSAPGATNSTRSGAGATPWGSALSFPAFRYEAKAPAHERPRLADGTAWPTVKPVALMQWLVRLVTPPGGTVLDPFCGTGTTGQACAIEGFNAVLLDRDPQAIALARVRLAKPVQPSLFGEAS